MVVSQRQLVLFLVLLATLIPLAQAYPLEEFFQGIYHHFWELRSTGQRAVVLCLIFFILAGFSGLDGELARPKLDIVSLEDASQPSNPRVYLDVSIDNAKPQRITIELFASVVPKTAENFRVLCSGENKKLHLKNSIFHRIVPGFMCQGGDITNHDGTGGMSIYGRTFEDEWNIEDRLGRHIPHTQAGLMSMANKGVNTNSSQFFITTAKTAWLDCRHVVFGQVQDGMKIVQKMEAAGSQSGKPSVTVKIVDCGEMKSKTT